MEPNCAGIVPFGEAFASFIADQSMVMVPRRGQAEKVLKNDVDKRRLVKILTPDDISYGLRRVVQNHRKVI